MLIVASLKEQPKWTRAGAAGANSTVGKPAGNEAIHDH